MKKYLIIGAILAAALVTIKVQHGRIQLLTAERNRYKTNTETLLSDAVRYKTNDSLNAATIGTLELTLKEYKRNMAEDYETIETLKAKNRDLKAVTTTQTETIAQLQGAVHDSIVYLSDTIKVVARCVDIDNSWVSLHGCMQGDQFNGDISVRDSLLITESVKYKRFLGFLWKTKRIKDRKFDIVSLNPYTQINGFRVVTIK